MSFRVYLTLPDEYKDKLTILTLMFEKSKASILNDMSRLYLDGIMEMFKNMGIDIKKDSIEAIKKKMNEINKNELLGNQLKMIFEAFQKMEVKEIEKKE